MGVLEERRSFSKEKQMGDGSPGDPHLWSNKHILVIQQRNNFKHLPRHQSSLHDGASSSSKEQAEPAAQTGTQSYGSCTHQRPRLNL